MKINYRQISVLVFLAFISVKFMALPSLMYTISGNMSWLVVLVLLFVDMAYVFMILGLMKKSGNKNILQFLSMLFGPVIARIILFAMLAKFALLTGHIINSLEFFVTENLYNQFDWKRFVLPLLIVIGFMIYKGIRNIARVSEMTIWAILLGLLYIGIKALSGVEIISFLPMFKDGVVPLFSGAYRYIAWFGSSLFMLVLFGDVDLETSKKGEMQKFVLLAIIIIMFLYFVFYGLYGNTSGIYEYCISDISQYATGQTSTEEISWLVVSLWIVAQAVQLTVYAFVMSKCIRLIFNWKSTIASDLIVLLYIFIWNLLSENTVHLEFIFYSQFVSVLTILTQYILPIVMWIAYGFNRLIAKPKQDVGKLTQHLNKKGELKHEKVKNTV